MNLLESAKRTYDTNSSIIKLIKKVNKASPKGSLVLYSKDNSASYYHQKCVEGSFTRKYIPKTETRLAKKLAQKSYNEKCLPALLKEQKVLKQFLKEYEPEKKYQIYENLNPARKELVEPIKTKPQLAYDDWLAESSYTYDGYSEYLRFQTDRGECVRSKSEVIIANFLNSQKDILDYRYEQPVWIESAHTRYHPDFTIFIKNTGGIIYHEHFGMMDDHDYVNEFTVKYNNYLLSGFIPGRDFLFTCETSIHPFSIEPFKKVILQLAKAD